MSSKIIAAIVTSILDWLTYSLGRLVVHVMKYFRQMSESKKDRDELKQAADKFMETSDKFKKSIEKKEPKQLQDLKKREMNDAFKEFIRFRPSKF